MRVPFKDTVSVCSTFNMTSANSSPGSYDSGSPLGPPGFDGTFDQAVGSNSVSLYVSVAAATLLVYDACVMFEREVHLVWCYGRWSWPTLLYLLNRYGTIIQACLNLITWFDYKFDLQSCLRWNLFVDWSYPLVIAWIQAAMTFRVIAFYGNTLRTSIFLWSYYLINTATMFTMMGLSLQGTYPVSSPAPPILGCILSSTGPSYLWQLLLAALLYETTVAVLTLLKAIEHKQLLSTPLFYTLVRDGFFYFFGVFAVVLLDLILSFTENALYAGWTPQLSLAFGSIMAVRLFLNLRDIAHPPGSSTELSDRGSVVGTTDAAEQISTPWTTQISEGEP